MMTPGDENMAKFERDAALLDATADQLNAEFGGALCRVSNFNGGQIEVVWYDMEATLSYVDGGEWVGSANKYGSDVVLETLRAATAPELVRALEAQVYGK